MASDFPWLLTLAALLLGGTAKGALGVGLPLVAIPILSLGMPAPQAIALLVMPVLLSNILQALQGDDFIRNLRRFSGLIAVQLVVTVLTVRVTLSLSSTQLRFMVAASVLLAVALMAFTPRFRVNERHERVASMAVGGMSGLLGGVSSLTGPLVVVYLMALKLSRDGFIASISMIYLGGAIPLYAAMFYYGRLDEQDLGLSMLALGPMGVGLFVGRRLRNLLNEDLFRKILLFFLTVVSALLLL